MEVAEDWCSLRQSNSCPAGNQIAVTVTPDCAGAGVSRLTKELDLFIRFVPGLKVPKHIFKGTGQGCLSGVSAPALGEQRGMGSRKQLCALLK